MLVQAMCGRYNRKTPLKQLATLFDAGLPGTDLRPSYNIAPTQPVAAVRLDTDGERQLVLLRWGLVPSWADDVKIGNRLINARADTASSKPSFRAAFKARRCLIPADGFYEWQKLDAKHKQPFNIRMKDERPFAFAGLWEHWQKDGGPVLETCTILTTEANELMKPIHDRMPVILPKTDWAAWLAPKTTKADAEQLLRPYEGQDLEGYPVSTWVNKPQNNDPKCLQPEGGTGLFA